jgi:histone-lysine N-methyltransferase MLL5
VVVTLAQQTSNMSVVLKIGVNQQSLLQKPLTVGIDPDIAEHAVTGKDVRSYQPPTHTYPSCFGLPYQDHNYGAPPPPTPPASPPPVPPRVNGHIDIEDIESTTEVVTTTEISTSPLATTPDHGALSNMDDSITRCICDFEHDDGYMICCDKCSVWQHVDCMGVDRDNIPDNYLCEKCEPRRVDKPRAVQIQARKRDEIAAFLSRPAALDSSATETEDETVRLGITPASARKNKSRRKKKERDKALKANKKIKKGKKEKLDKKKEKAIKKQQEKLVSFQFCRFRPI